jgi:hypothetical protein
VTKKTKPRTEAQKERANQRRRERRKAPVQSFVNEPRYKLHDLADEIEQLVAVETDQLKHRSFPRSIQPRLAAWFVSGARAYLGGKYRTLDHALGFVRSRGNPGKPQWTRERLIEAELLLAQKDEKGRRLHTRESVAKKFRIRKRTLDEQLKRQRAEIALLDVQKILDGLR